MIIFKAFVLPWTIYLQAQANDTDFVGLNVGRGKIDKEWPENLVSAVSCSIATIWRQRIFCCTNKYSVYFKWNSHPLLCRWFLFYGENLSLASWIRSTFIRFRILKFIGEQSVIAYQPTIHVRYDTVHLSSRNMFALFPFCGKHYSIQGSAPYPIYTLHNICLLNWAMSLTPCNTNSNHRFDLIQQKLETIIFNKFDSIQSDDAYCLQLQYIVI